MEQAAIKKLISVILEAVVFILIIAAGIYFLVINKPKTEVGEQVSPVVPETLDVVSKIDELTNPVGDKLPDLNPVDKTNPFKNIYENPFK